ncbi:MAG: CpsD/CapB family tyrosine-protein kinase [Phycisphaerae bacterium]|nr:CpsD/CapB family tyrosine-protein kinase [Phycisphaerae bacterium]
MGRIADALKKAEQERASAGGVAVAEPVGTTVAEADGAPAPFDVDPTQIETTPSRNDDSPTWDPAGSRRAEQIAKVSPLVVALHGQDSILIEQYRALRTRLASQNPRARSRVLAITSSVAGEGKSVTAANLGVVLAEVKHHRVLVLDADFRRSSLAKLFGLVSEPGLTEVLQGKFALENVVQRTPADNLELISAGNTRGIKPAELLSSKCAAAIFDDLRDRYSYVLVDTPPSSDVADAGIVGQLADGVLMVIRMGKTSQPMVKQIVQSLQASQVNLIGCVLTGSQDANSPYNYYGGYGYHDDES